MQEAKKRLRIQLLRQKRKTQRKRRKRQKDLPKRILMTIKRDSSRRKKIRKMNRLKILPIV